MSAVLTFLAPPPGFAPHTDFVLDPVDGADGLFALHATAQPGLRVHLVDPRTVGEEYAPVLPDDQVAALALASPDDALLLVIARPTDEGVSVNLMAPVVVNARSGAAVQVILEDQGFSVRALLT
ncbi:flagellar assembly protein FliW [Microbacterium protaetiae]|uniref:Flagellar assembly protein FliW n=1 Tax=Microbacterium protaetiae TaxID=2509458 RepID=A0A4P6EQ82_9MICO|nr:flagellar assembly protein FliW [Microbacterium protaetiae]QAY60088.1 flagellar assembly protein FliW [Microbacterium protaetiae]